MGVHVWGWAPEMRKRQLAPQVVNFYLLIRKNWFIFTIFCVELHTKNSYSFFDWARAPTGTTRICQNLLCCKFNSGLKLWLYFKKFLDFWLSFMELYFFPRLEGGNGGTCPSALCTLTGTQANSLVAGNPRNLKLKCESANWRLRQLILFIMIIRN